MSGPFNPRGAPPGTPGTFGDYPQQPSKPTIQGGSWGEHVRYLEGSLYWASAQTQLYVDPNSTPCFFGSADTTALRNFQGWWGLTVDGICGPVTWGVIDYNNALQGFY